MIKKGGTYVPTVVVREYEYCKVEHSLPRQRAGSGTAVRQSTLCWVMPGHRSRRRLSAHYHWRGGSDVSTPPPQPRCVQYAQTEKSHHALLFFGGGAFIFSDLRFRVLSSESASPFFWASTSAWLRPRTASSNPATVNASHTQVGYVPDSPKCCFKNVATNAAIEPSKICCRMDRTSRIM